MKHKAIYSIDVDGKRIAYGPYLWYTTDKGRVATLLTRWILDYGKVNAKRILVGYMR